MGEVVLETSNITKSYGDMQAMRGTSFQVRRGEVLGLLGPNGAGKATTISVIGLIEPVVRPEHLALVELPARGGGRRG